MEETKLTYEEAEVLDETVKLWNLFVKLPQLHLDETDEFKTHLHALQRIIMSRIYLRYMGKSALEG